MSGKKKRGVVAGGQGDEARKPMKPEDHRPKKIKRADWEKVFWRYVSVTAVMSIMYVIYRWHPYYQRPQFRPWHPFFETAYMVWLAGGIPYVMITLRKFGGRKMDFTDGAVMYLLWGRGIYYWLFEGCRWPRHIWSNRRMRVTVLSLGVKAFFTPLMTIFMSEHANNIWSMWLRRRGTTALTPDQVKDMNVGDLMTVVDRWWVYIQETAPKIIPSMQNVVDFFNLSTWAPGDKYYWADFYYQLLFFVDCIWALTGYAAESRWLNNKTRSVEPTGFGWMVALMCYPPFNDISGTYFPLGRGQLIFSEDMAWICRLLMLAAFTIYVWATLAFGPTFSNLTNRGIITRGPYAFIRHPAYACKNFAWWMEYLPYLQGWSTVFWLIAWNIIYGLRAWTEERHLSRDPDYRVYKKKVKWAALPGVF